jgi:uncharacterized protein with NAD-binding domain and iron-sulfur cluster
MRQPPTRRAFLRDAALISASTAGAMAFGLPAVGASTSTGKDVAVFGAGVAGLTAAHELAERGFSVTVYERDHLGGKAWSIPVPGSASGGRIPLPGEHGFRFFPGFYKNLGDTMRRIPTPEGTVYDRLRRASTYRTSFEGHPDLTIPLSLPPLGVTPDAFTQSLAAVLRESYTLPLDEAMYFAAKLFVYVSSCDARRLGQWDNVAWSQFISEDKMSEEYRTVLSRSLVRNLAATQSGAASTHSIGLVGLASMMSLAGFGNDQHATFDRVLDGPTSTVWLDEWVNLLTGMGVTFKVGWTLDGLDMAGGRLSSAQVSDPAGQSHEVQASWYVCALPLERMAALLTPEMLAADPRLAGITRLQTDWMTGLQFYLRQPLPVTNGHVNYANSPWALTSISQGQFWDGDLSGYGDGTVKESFSTIISDWVTPGIVYGKPAKACTRQQVADEVWAQLKAHLNKSWQAPVLTDDMLHSWFLDPAMIDDGRGGLDNTTPLFIQPPGEWANRPDSKTRIGNLFLAGDWVRTNINVTTMDGANQGGRQAANAVLDAAGSIAPRARLWSLYVPPEFEPVRLIDRQLYALGQPNLFDPDHARPGH